MAISQEGMQRAEITYCYQIDVQRMAHGAFAQTETRLPWAFVRFADDGEERRYVSTLDGDSVGLALLGARPYRVQRETMRNAPFPHETDQGPRPTDGDGSKAGPIGIHFIGPV